MSAFGPKQTLPGALHESAFGGKADMTVCGSPLSRSLLGVKQTSSVAPHMSAFDPKRTSTLCKYQRTSGALDHRRNPTDQLGLPMENFIKCSEGIVVNLVNGSA